MTFHNEKNTDLLKKQLHHIGWDDRFDSYLKEIVSIKYPEQAPSPVPQASVVIISCKISKATIDTLKKLRKEQTPFEIIFVDNDSQTEHGQEALDLSDIHIRLIKNKGAYMARNIGAAFCRSPLLIFLDDDAVPVGNFVQKHIDDHAAHEAILVRGVCMPITESILNEEAKHYHLGDDIFPRFSDLEGNISVAAENFFAAGGWDDLIKFGHGGIDLSYRLLINSPYPQQLLYSPHPIILHDYTSDIEALVEKRYKQAGSWRYLQSKHAEIDSFLPLWEREWSKLPPVAKGEADKLVQAANFHSATKEPEENKEIASMLRLAKRYADKGNVEKAREYEQKAHDLQSRESDTPATQAPVDDAELTDAQAMALADLLVLGEYEQVLSARNSKHEQLPSLLTAASMRKGDLETARELIDGFEDNNEMRLKRKALELLPKLAEPLSGTPRVHLIILCHNREEELLQAFKELAKTNYDNYAVYIADNGSTDKTWERIQEAVKFFPDHIHVEIERLPTNIGRPAGHNWLLTKYDHSASDYIAIGDDDLVYVPGNWLIDMLKTAELFPNDAAVGGKALDPGLPPIVHAGVRNIEKFEGYNLGLTNGSPMPDFGQFDFIDLVDHVIGCLHIYETKRFLDEVGLFDISLSPCQCVDIEHHLRTKTLGYDIVFNGFIQFRHLRAMGKKTVKDKAMAGNSIGNVFKIMTKYDHDKVHKMLEDSRAARDAWLYGEQG